MMILFKMLTCWSISIKDLFPHLFTFSLTVTGHTCAIVFQESGYEKITPSESFRKWLA